MKIRTAFLAIVVLLTFASCGDDFDAEAEISAVRSVEQEIFDALANADGEALLSHFHEDYMGFETFEALKRSTSRQDLRPSQITAPVNLAWESSEVFIAADLAVIRGCATLEVPPNPKEGVYQTHVYKKEDGEWYLIHGHTSAGYRCP